MIRIMEGDNLATLSGLPAKSVHMAVTSPPYFGLRSYVAADSELKSMEHGSERTPDAYIARQVEVFRAVRRVLRDDGTLWVNIGETYAGSGNGAAHYPASSVGTKQSTNTGTLSDNLPKSNVPDGLKPGDRVGIPERFALAMQNAGWIWRDTIIWHKPAPMPTSVNGWRWERCKVKVAKSSRGVEDFSSQAYEASQGDHRNGQIDGSASWSDCPGCTKCAPNGGYVLRKGSWRTTTAHEYIFLFAKTSDYYCDREAVAQPASTATVDRNKYTRKLDDPDEQFAVKHDHEFTGATANLRSVWTIGPEPLKHSHYAAYPSELPRRCIAAGTSAKGVCVTCGAPWARVIEGSAYTPEVVSDGVRDVDASRGDKNRKISGAEYAQQKQTKTICWRPTCSCADSTPIPATILDPYGGSGTSAIAATLLGRDAIMCELNPKYVEIMRARFAETAPLLMQEALCQP